VGSLVGGTINSTSVTATGTSNQIVLGSTNTTTISAAAPSSSRTVNISSTVADGSYVATSSIGLGQMCYDVIGARTTVALSASTKYRYYLRGNGGGSGTSYLTDSSGTMVSGTITQASSSLNGRIIVGISNGMCVVSSSQFTTSTGSVPFLSSGNFNAVYDSSTGKDYIEFVTPSSPTIYGILLSVLTSSNSF